MSTRAMAGCAMLICATAWVLAAPACANDAASALADKFATEPDKRDAERKAEDARKREAELKADKEREEAAARRAEQMRKADEDKARAKAKKVATPRPPAVDKRAEEAEMQARARREAEEMQALDEARILAEQEAALERAKAELAASQAAEKERARLDELAREAAGMKPAAVASEAEAERALAESAQCAQETRRVVASYKRVREIRQARLMAVAQREAVQKELAQREAAQREAAQKEAAERELAEREAAERAQAQLEAARVRPTIDTPRTDVAAAKPATESTGSTLDTTSSQLGRSERAPDVADRGDTAKSDRAVSESLRSFLSASEKIVTVLIVMAPGDYGIRRGGPKVADPVLCTWEGCYISTGAGTPSQFLPGRKALNFGNTMGLRAGACRQQLGCIFRGVDLGTLPGHLQPVDLHILKHDRRQEQVIEASSACRADAGHLTCDRGIYAEDYAMWVIPESLADAAGPAALERALVDGLAAPRSADLDPRRLR